MPTESPASSTSSSSIKLMYQMQQSQHHLNYLVILVVLQIIQQLIWINILPIQYLYHRDRDGYYEETTVVDGIEHSRGSLCLQEFNRSLIQCGVILHQQDLNVFDKHNTGLIDYSHFAENSLVHRVRGIKTENVSVNLGINQYTKITLAIAAAFEEINTSTTGEITLGEFRLVYRKNGIEIYGSVTQIFERLCTFKNNNNNNNENFIEAFQGTIFANRAEAPKLKEILSKLGITQWTLGDNYSNTQQRSINNNPGPINANLYYNKDGINTVQSNISILQIVHQSGLIDLPPKTELIIFVGVYKKTQFRYTIQMHIQTHIHNNDFMPQIINK